VKASTKKLAGNGCLAGSADIRIGVRIDAGKIRREPNLAGYKTTPKRKSTTHGIALQVCDEAFEWCSSAPDQKTRRCVSSKTDAAGVGRSSKGWPKAIAEADFRDERV
jgi:hypothetical protein